ncbi:MAG: ABC transporter substrate-binding protein [Candidatus Berkiella sp.]
MPIYFGKNSRVLLLLSALFFTTGISAEQDKPLIHVKIGLLESLSPTAPSSSERYKRLYESTLYYAIGENDRKLNQCGYKLTANISYFDTFDALDLLENAKQVRKTEPWLVIGPRRSGHIKTALTIIDDTPTISTMANSDTVLNNTPHLFSMYPTTSSLAKVMVQEVKNRNYGTTYGIIVDARCQSCVEFSKNFQIENPRHQPLFYISVGDNTPDIKKLISNIQTLKPDYLVIPNYSELSGYIISETQRINPNLKYVGADGWGEDTFSFIQGYNIHPNTMGMAVRFGVKKEEKSNFYDAHSLEREIDGSLVTPPYSIYSLVSMIRTLTDDLCKTKPINKNEFKKYLLQQSKTHFQTETQYSIYHLQNGKIIFSNYVKTS